MTTTTQAPGVQLKGPLVTTATTTGAADAPTKPKSVMEILEAEGAPGLEAARRKAEQEEIAVEGLPPQPAHAPPNVGLPGAPMHHELGAKKQAAVPGVNVPLNTGRPSGNAFGGQDSAPGWVRLQDIGDSRVMKRVYALEIPKKGVFLNIVARTVSGLGVIPSEAMTWAGGVTLKDLREQMGVAE